MINNGLDQTHTFIEIVASHTLTSQWAQPRQTARPLPPTAAWDLSLPPQLFLHTHEGSWFLILRGLSASFLPSSTPPTYSSPSSTNQTCTPSRPPSPWGSHSSLFVFSPVLNVHHLIPHVSLHHLNSDSSVLLRHYLHQGLPVPEVLNPIIHLILVCLLSSLGMLRLASV